MDGNPMYKDMVAAAKMAKLAFICNVVIDEDKKTVAAFAGNFETAHFTGTESLPLLILLSPPMEAIHWIKMLISVQRA